jgi:dTDP-4-dehydrorhamnose reductase
LDPNPGRLSLKILLFGAGGQLGTAIVSACAATSGLEIIPAPRSIDIYDAAGVAQLIDTSAPDWVINCAAMTNVDGAHENPALAMGVNALGPANIARAAEMAGARVIQISTEAVFDGERTTAYNEDDACHPVAVYGISKLAGEMMVRLYNPSSFVLRTSWLYSSNSGVNFPTRLLQQLEAHDQPVSVVTDVVGNPTPSAVLAGAVLAVVGNPPEPGTYHACCLGAVTKFDWAVEIARSGGFDTSRIVPVTSADYPTVALRPKYVDLSCEKFMSTGVYALPRWKDAWRESLD